MRELPEEKEPAECGSCRKKRSRRNTGDAGRKEDETWRDRKMSPR